MRNEQDLTQWERQQWCHALASPGTCYILHISKISPIVGAGRGHNLGTLLFLPLLPHGALRAQQSHVPMQCRLQQVYLVLIAATLFNVSPSSIPWSLPERGPSLAGGALFFLIF